MISHELEIKGLREQREALKAEKTKKRIELAMRKRIELH